MGGSSFWANGLNFTPGVLLWQPSWNRFRRPLDGLTIRPTSLRLQRLGISSRLRLRTSHLRRDHRSQIYALHNRGFEWKKHRCGNCPPMRGIFFRFAVECLEKLVCSGYNKDRRREGSGRDPRRIQLSRLLNHAKSHPTTPNL